MHANVTNCNVSIEAFKKKRDQKNTYRSLKAHSHQTPKTIHKQLTIMSCFPVHTQSSLSVVSSDSVRPCGRGGLSPLQLISATDRWPDLLSKTAKCKCEHLGSFYWWIDLKKGCTQCCLLYESDQMQLSISTLKHLCLNPHSFIQYWSTNNKRCRYQITLENILSPKKQVSKS